MKNYTTKIGHQKMIDDLHHLNTVEYKNSIDNKAQAALTEMGI